MFRVSDSRKHQARETQKERKCELRKFRKRAQSFERLTRDELVHRCVELEDQLKKAQEDNAFARDKIDWMERKRK